MIRMQLKRILVFCILLINSFLFAEECTDTSPTQYGSCQTPLGFVWTGNSCVLVYGCDIGSDEELFYNTYEECDITCSNNTSLGDINNDSQINVIDIVQLVNLILNVEDFNASADINFDNLNNVIDIVNLVGQRVKTLVEDYSLAGYHQVVWDGTDEMGISLGSGIYFIRAQIGKEIYYHKMMKIK